MVRLKYFYKKTFLTNHIFLGKSTFLHKMNEFDGNFEFKNSKKSYGVLKIFFQKNRGHMKLVIGHVPRGSD